MGWGAGEGLHTLFEIVAFLRLRSLRLFLTESHSPFTCHRQRSSSILRSFERRPSPQTVIKDMYCHKFKATAPLIIPSKQKNGTVWSRLHHFFFRMPYHCINYIINFFTVCSLYAFKFFGKQRIFYCI